MCVVFLKASCPELPPLANENTFSIVYPGKIPVVLYYCRERGYFLEGINRCECVDGVWKADKRDVLLDSNHPRCVEVDSSEAKAFSYSLRTPSQYAVGKDNEYQLTVSVP